MTTVVDLTVLPGFVAAVVLILIAPGPDMAYMVAVGLEGGRKAAVRAIFGICSGMSVYAVAVVAGLGALVGSHPWLLTGVKIFGVVYLLWLGIGAARSAKRSVESTQGFVAGRWYLRGVLVSLTNPKIILFFLAFLPQFIGQAQSPALQMALLGGVDVLIELIIYGAVGLFAGVFHMRFAGNRKATVLLNYTACAVYILLAGVVIVELVSP